MKKLLAIGLLLPTLACAQAFPSRPIQMLVPYPAGGTTDVMARGLQEPLQKALGYSLLFINSGIVAVTLHVQKDAGFDGVKDFAPMALATMAPLFVIVPGNLPVTDLRSYIDYVKQQPTPLAFASAGVGSFGHLSSELFLRAAGLKMTHIPYRGQAPTTNAVLTGEMALLVTRLMSKDIQDRFTALGQQVRTMTPAQLGSLIAEDSARWGQVVRDNNISAQ